MPKYEPGDKARRERSLNRSSTRRREPSVETAEHFIGLTAAETNSPELLGRSEHDLQTALHEGRLYLHAAKGAAISIGDVLENYRMLRNGLDHLTLGELWPCIVTQFKDRLPFSAPLDVPPSLAAMLVAQLRSMSIGDDLFPSAPAPRVQSAVAEALPREVARTQPYFFGASQKLVGLPKDNAEAGFVRGAKLDIDVRMSFSGCGPPELAQEARVAVETAKPNISVVYTHGYFLSTLKQLGVSTPAIGSLGYGLYRFGIEVDGFHLFQESLVSIPDQLKIWLDLEPRD